MWAPDRCIHLLDGGRNKNFPLQYISRPPLAWNVVTERELGIRECYFTSFPTWRQCDSECLNWVLLVKGEQLQGYACDLCFFCFFGCTVWDFSSPRWEHGVCFCCCCCCFGFFFWLGWVFIAACELSLAAASSGYSSLWCVGFPLRWPLLLRSTGSRHMGFSSCGSRALECRLSSCGARA